MNFQNKFNESLQNAGIPMPELVQKNKAIAFVLALLFGVFGVHRFYLGKFITGFFQLIFGLIFIWGSLAWICFVFVIIDLIRIAFDPRFTQKINLKIDINLKDFTSNSSYTYTNSPFSNMHNRDEEAEKNQMRELNDDEVIVTDTYQAKIIHGEDTKR
jgi:TM2 domain-containing membrane protein YozV